MQLEDDVGNPTIKGTFWLIYRIIRGNGRIRMIRPTPD
jgi:hypothetical protein